MEEKAHKRAIWAWTMYDWGNSGFCHHHHGGSFTGLLFFGRSLEPASPILPLPTGDIPPALPHYWLPSFRLSWEPWQIFAAARKAS